MAGLDNPDVDADVLHDINGLADRLPGWAEAAVAPAAEAVLPAAMALLSVAAWLVVRRRPDAVPAVAGIAWAVVAAGIAFLVNVPIRGFVGRPRPLADHPDVVVLLDGRTGFSFVSDHATMAMAVAVALLLVHRSLGCWAFALAVFQGFLRVLMGVHYPTDVIGGFALGTAVALLLAPAAQAGLTPLIAACAGTRRLAWVARPQSAGGRSGGEPWAGPPDGAGAETAEPETEEEPEREGRPPAEPVAGRHRASRSLAA